MNIGNGIQADVAHAIQLALAPVFLLTGIAGLLNVMASRLGRIVDRGRSLTESPGVYPAETCAREIPSLERRRYFASSAITACTVSALLVCIVIAMLFLEVFLSLPLKWLEGVLFTCATLSLTVGLGYFSREVHLATQTVKLEQPPKPPAKAPESEPEGR